MFTCLQLCSVRESSLPDTTRSVLCRSYESKVTQWTDPRLDAILFELGPSPLLAADNMLMCRHEREYHPRWFPWQISRCEMFTSYPCVQACTMTFSLPPIGQRSRFATSKFTPAVRRPT